LVADFALEKNFFARSRILSRSASGGDSESGSSRQCRNKKTMHRGFLTSFPRG
jgi:hypothetical protein